MLPTTIRARPTLAALGGLVALLAAMAAWAATADDWQKLFNAIPAPPATGNDALARIRATAGPGGAVLEFSDATVLKLRATQKALRDAGEKAALSAGTKTYGSAAGGIDMGRMQSDPDYAADVQKRMQSMSDAEKMQMAMQMNSAAQQSAMQTVKTDQGMLAYNTQMHSDPARTAALATPLEALQKRYDQQHQDLDSKLINQFSSELQHCPVSGQCGEAGCTRLASCESPIRARLPAAVKALVEQHHQLAAKELTEAAQLFKSARAGLAPSFNHMAELAAKSEKVGASGQDMMTAVAMFDEDVGYLLTLSRSIALHGGFWAGIREQSNPAQHFHESANPQGNPRALSVDLYEFPASG